MIIYFYCPGQQNIALQKAIGELNQSLKEASENNQKTLLLLSGGSSLALLSGIDIDNLNQNITISPLDERYSKDPKENNMTQITETDFYKNATLKKCTFIDTKVKEGETQEELSLRFDNELKNWLSSNPQGLIITTMGIGSDGHISGIMPYPESPEKFKTMFDNQDNSSFVIAYDAKEKNPYPKRVTTTMNFLRKIQTAIVYIVGESKLKALGDLKSEKGDLATTPARILKELDGNISVFTDLKQ